MTEQGHDTYTTMEINQLKIFIDQFKDIMFNTIVPSEG